ATPATVPAATEWSPPSTTGTLPASRVLSTNSACLVQVAVISFRYLAWGSPSFFCSAMATLILPASSTTWPRASRRASRPATRTAEGPMSTPRRDWPRSRGTPITRILRGTIKGSTARGAAAGRSCLGLSFISFSKPFHHRDTETQRKPSQKLNQRNSAKSIPLDGGYVQSSQHSVHKLTAAL